jgi:phenylpyruvate tautomerase PptA (4-oxalocrotonate tautomerase family)
MRARFPQPSPPKHEETFMPNIIVKIPEGAFDEAGRAALGKEVHAAAKAVEGWGDDPRQEALTWVLVEEVKPGCLFAGGIDQTLRIIPVIVFFYPPAGVIDQAGRVEVVKRVHQAIAAAKSASDPRQVATSIMIWEVADGTWGGNGQLWSLPDFARAAGYKHLQHLVSA